MKTEFVRVAITFPGVPVAIMAFVTHGRSHALPSGATWIDSGTQAWERLPTQQNIDTEIRKAFQGRVPTFWRLIGEDEIPKEYGYRDAWVDHPKLGIRHDMPKAREIHRTWLRGARKKHLARLDAEWMAANRKKDKASIAQIDARKQSLLDVPADPRIEAANTVEELKAVTLPLSDG